MAKGFSHILNSDIAVLSIYSKPQAGPGLCQSIGDGTWDASNHSKQGGYKTGQERIESISAGANLAFVLHDV